MSFIKIGVLATLLGPFARGGEDGVRGVQLAVGEFGGEIAGKRLRLLVEGTNAMPEDAYSKAQNLMERDGADFIVGPLSGNEGIAVRDFAKTKPDKTFINGIAGAQEMTLHNPAPNFFNFTTNGVQWMYGLGEYVYKTLGYKQVVTLGEDYSFPHSQVGGFTLDYCAAGGKILQKFWVPLGTVNYTEIINSIPPEADAVFMALGGSDAINFLKQYDEFGGKTPLIGGTIAIDQTVLSVRGTLAERLVGAASSGPIAEQNPAPEWMAFVAAYRRQFPDGFPSPSLFAYGFYTNTKAALLGLKAVHADLSDGQAKFQKALSTLVFNNPSGTVKLDHNRQAIANNFITRVDRQPDGTLYNKLVKVVPNVEQTMGIPESEYLKIGQFGRDNPRC